MKEGERESWTAFLFRSWHGVAFFCRFFLDIKVENLTDEKFSESLFFVSNNLNKNSTWHLLWRKICQLLKRWRTKSYFWAKKIWPRSISYGYDSIIFRSNLLFLINFSTVEPSRQTKYVPIWDTMTIYHQIGLI